MLNAHDKSWISLSHINQFHSSYISVVHQKPLTWENSIMRELEHFGKESICSLTFSISISEYCNQKAVQIVISSKIAAFAITNFTRRSSCSRTLNPLNWKALRLDTKHWGTDVEVEASLLKSNTPWNIFYV